MGVQGRSTGGGVAEATGSDVAHEKPAHALFGTPAPSALEVRVLTYILMVRIINWYLKTNNVVRGVLGERPEGKGDHAEATWDKCL